MKSLYELCEPRDSVFDEGQRDDVLDLSDLIENRINIERFFKENYLTEGMKVLLDAAFNRFHRMGSTGLIKLIQSMGGGKTHNMIALGLLAIYPKYRKEIMGEQYQNSHLEKIKVVAFTGRESDAPLGIWGTIATQLGKKDLFNEYYSPLSAPGQSAWINMLKGEPLLILLDELPPYLENARSKLIGNTDLSIVTTTALSNLFIALGKEELSNITVVISDLKAIYESGSQLLQSAFKELEGEINRSALNLEPVRIASDEVYNILKKRLFKKLPSDEEIMNIAQAYSNSVKEAKQMGYTNTSPDQILVGIKDSYPFHPSLKDLYARFKENPGFQQTRGLIRLLRRIVSQLWDGDPPESKEKYLIHAYDFNLNDREMFTTISQIKPSLTNAISHDIASNGQGISEVLDASVGNTITQNISKLLLVSSLADVPNALLGLSMQETIGYVCEPRKDITDSKKAFDDLIMKAWYLDTDRDGKLYFKNTKNLIAEINSLVESYDNEMSKKELRNFLEEKFKPLVRDCYQNVSVFPPVDEINLSEEKVSLILFEPYSNGGLHPTLQSFYDDTRFKNRIMFLTGQRRTMENLLKTAKEFKAIQKIIARMKEEKVPESNSQYQSAVDKEHKITLHLLQAARETFLTLYYPTKNGLLPADFLMEFQENNFNGEEQIKKVLEEKQKFTDDISSDIFRKKCEDRIFTQKEMRWIDIKERAATNPAWPWHIPSALDSLKETMLKKEIWQDHGGYIEKGPFPKKKTSLQIQQTNWDDKTGEATLKIIPKYGDRVYYEINGSATTASLPVDDLNNFKTRELKLSFLCIDSTNEHGTGDPKEWKNQIGLKYKKPYNKGDDLILELTVAPHGIPIRYTTDGSNPKEYGGIYENEILIPDICTFVQAIAEKDGISSEILKIPIDRSKIGLPKIDLTSPIMLSKRKRTQDTSQTYQEIDLFKKYNAILSDVKLSLFKTDENNNEKGWIELIVDRSILINLDKLETLIETLRSTFMPEGRINITLTYQSVQFKTGQDFIDWIADKKLNLKDFKEEEIRQ